VNDPYYGGLGDKIAIISASITSGALALTHELGHNFMDVGEEYVFVGRSRLHATTANHYPPLPPPPPYRRYDGGWDYSGENFAATRRPCSEAELAAGPRPVGPAGGGGAGGAARRMVWACLPWAHWLDEAQPEPEDAGIGAGMRGAVSAVGGTGTGGGARGNLRRGGGGAAAAEGGGAAGTLPPLTDPAPPPLPEPLPQGAVLLLDEHPWAVLPTAPGGASSGPAPGVATLAASGKQPALPPGQQQPEPFSLSFRSEGGYAHYKVTLAHTPTPPLRAPQRSRSLPLTLPCAHCQVSFSVTGCGRGRSSLAVELDGESLPYAPPESFAGRYG
jgi:hypothetical protein